MLAVGTDLALVKLVFLYLYFDEDSMFNIIVSFIIVLFSALTPRLVFADEINMERARQIIKKYNTTYERPNSCPLESRKYVDLMSKTEAIKEAIKGNCLKAEAAKKSEVLTSIKTLQDNMKSNASVASFNGLSDFFKEDKNSNNVVNGHQISSVLTNINSLIKNGQCDMEDGSILQSTADLIYGSTQLGVLSGNPSGLVVAGGGFVVSSALRLIDLIIKQRFDFEKPADRISFIKLNCSFYEIRRELDTVGALDLENSTTREDFRDAKSLAGEITVALKRNENEKANSSLANAEIDRAVVKEYIGDVSGLKKTLAKVKKYLQPGLNQTLELPTETQKFLMISQLAQDYDLLISQVSAYKDLNISSIPMLDDLFIMELKKIDPMDAVSFTAALNISAKDFNDNYRAVILFHIIRIGLDIEAKEQKIINKGDNQKLQLAIGVDRKSAEYLAVLVELRKIESRLGNIISPTEYSGLDDGSDNMVAIIDNHNKISDKLYGTLGDKFLKFATEKSYSKTMIFNERLAAFNNKYSEIIKLDKVDKIKTSYLCQDAQKLRLMFKHADSIVQEGYDFVITNKDLIFSDVGNSYIQTFNEDEGMGANGSSLRIQRHYKSVIYALKKIKGEDITTEDSKRYVQKNILGNYYLGRSMIEVSNSKVSTKKVQDIYEQFSCQRSLSADIN